MSHVELDPRYRGADTPHFLPRQLPLGEVSDRVLTIPVDFARYRRAWWALFIVSCLLLGLFVASAVVVLWRGVGVFGNNIPVNWGFPILNYMWWLGIGHAGTFISAMLLLLNRLRPRRPSARERLQRRSRRSRSRRAR